MFIHLLLKLGLCVQLTHRETRKKNSNTQTKTLILIRALVLRSEWFHSNCGCDCKMLCPRSLLARVFYLSAISSIWTRKRDNLNGCSSWFFEAPIQQLHHSFWHALNMVFTCVLFFSWFMLVTVVSNGKKQCEHAETSFPDTTQCDTFVHSMHYLTQAIRKIH